MAERLRKGMWVLVDGHVGILNNFDADGRAEVHLVDEHGDTTLVTIVDPLVVAPAPLNLIPAPRRPSAAVARKFGYA